MNIKLNKWNAHKRSKKVINIWILCCAVIQLIPLFISIWLYTQNIQPMLKEEIIHSNQLIINQIRDKLDFLFDKVNIVKNELALMPEAKRFSEMTMQELPNNRYELSVLCQEFAKFSYVYLENNDFFVFFPQINMVISNNNAQSMQNYYTYSDIENMMSYDEWLKTIELPKNDNFIQLQKIGTNTMLYLSNIFTRNEEVVFGVLLNERMINDILGNTESINYTNMFIIDSNGEVLLSNKQENNDIPIDFTETIEKAEGYFETDNGYIVRFANSTIMPWKYASVVEAKSFWNQLRTTQLLIIIGMGIAFALTVFVTMRLIFYNYTSVKRILKLVKNATMEKKFSDSVNEYVYIENVLHKLVSEKQHVVHILEEEKKRLTDLNVKKLLRGVFEKQVAIDMEKDFLGKTECRYFVVIEFHVESFQSLFQEDEIDEMEQQLTGEFIITNVFEELLNQDQGYKGYIVNDNEDIFALVCINETVVDSVYQELRKVLSYGQQFIEKNFDLPIKIALSDICDSAEKVTKMYYQAKNIMKYQVITEKEKILDYPNYCNIEKEKTPLTFILADENYLAECVKNQNYHEAKQYIEQIFDRLIEIKGGSVEIIRFLMLNIASSVIKAIGDIYINWDEKIDKNMNIINEIMKCNSISSMKKLLLDLIEEICHSFSQNTKTGTLSIRIKKYIEQNYGNLEVNVSTIGRQFGLVPRYISKIFKEETGIGLLDYINNVRVKHAKEAIVSTKLTMEEIAFQNGFSNLVTFIRVFKKFTGVTPGRYREQYKHRS